MNSDEFDYRMSFEEFSQGKTCRISNPEEIPIGNNDYFNGVASEFKSAIRLGDLLYYYISDIEKWEQLMGSEGYVIVREGIVIDELVLKMN